MATTEASEVSLMIDTMLLVCGGIATRRLGEDHLPDHLPEPQAERQGGLRLAAGNALDAGSQDLGREGCENQDEGEARRGEGRERHPDEGQGVIDENDDD